MSFVHEAMRCNINYHKPRSSTHRHAHGRLLKQSNQRARQRSAIFALPFVPPVCFDAVCQANADRAFLIAISVPLVTAAAAIAHKVRRPPEANNAERAFEDPETGNVFFTDAGVQPERDKTGQLAFRVVSYTPWPVDADYAGERIRIDVGPIKKRLPRTFVFSKVLPGPSEILAVTLPRPLGIVLEYDERRKRAVVVDLIEGSYADQRRKVSGMNQALSQAILPGDVLRGVTCTTIVYPTKALFGAIPPERHIVVYGADNMKFAEISGALKRGEVKDGEVTVIVERKMQT
mmetsp:Transcript_12730/g.27574  ORF Transcript_12730/g.27574 Transcript_12730/m.27574 type:complete len:290 (-) Transcript_12730:387-1256(-)